MEMPIRWFSPSSLFLVGCLLPGSAGVAAAMAPPSPLPTHSQIRLEDGLLSVEVRDAPLADVLVAVGAQAGFQTIVGGPVERTITTSFSRLPIDEALKRLLHGTDYVMLHQAADRPDGAPFLTQIWLLGDIDSPGDDTARALDRVTSQADTAGRLRSQDMLRLVQEGPTRDVIETLGYALAWDDQPLVRTRAAMALGALGDERAVPPLAAALADEHPTVRRQAIQALSQITDEAAILALGDVLLHDADSRQRVLAAWGLWRQDSDLARSFLEQAADDLDEKVRTAATRSPPSVVNRVAPALPKRSEPGFESTQ